MTTSPARTRGRAPARTEHDGPDIFCDNLVRIFSSEGVEVVALQGLDLEVGRGELVAIVGASGSAPVYWPTHFSNASSQRPSDL